MAAVGDIKTTGSQQIQVVNDEGQFLGEDVQAFVQAVDLPAAKDRYQVVAIMGPQSSGKSTLLNHVVRVTCHVVPWRGSCTQMV
jgi:ABC-type lipoprotein export system ATPase subunit